MLGHLQVPRPVVVLGSRQPLAHLDAGALARDDVAVLRRRGGGGAVLLGPEDCWMELWLPADSPVAGRDVRRTACIVGEWWQRAAAGLGISTDVHRAGLVDGDQGAIACFAGLGPGELTASGNKLLGISQWRSREGTLVSAVVAAHAPSGLAAYLSEGAGPTPALLAATSLFDVAPDVDAHMLAAAVTAVIVDAEPGIGVEPSAFR